MTQYDPDGANALLDEVGLKDVDRYGFRKLPNREPFEINIDYAALLSGALEVKEVVHMWNNIGVKTSSKR
jgi:peptide/nickel transport system substrate-binding protein